MLRIALSLTSLLFSSVVPHLHQRVDHVVRGNDESLTPEYVPFIVLNAEDKQIAGFHYAYVGPLAFPIDALPDDSVLGQDISTRKHTALIKGVPRKWSNGWNAQFSRLHLCTTEAELDAYYSKNKRKPLALGESAAMPLGVRAVARKVYGAKECETQWYSTASSFESQVNDGLKLLLLKLARPGELLSPQEIERLASQYTATMWVDSHFRAIVQDPAVMASLRVKPGIVQCTKGAHAACVAWIKK